MVEEHHENVVANLDIGVRFYRSVVTTNGYVPFHWHSSIEVVCVLAGELRFNFSGETHVVGPHQFMVVSSGVVHDVTNTPNRAYVLQIPLPFMTPYVAHADQLHFRVTPDDSPAYRQVVRDFEGLGALIQQQKVGYLFDMGALVLHLLKGLVVNFTEATGPATQVTSNLKNLIVYVNAHYRQPLTVHGLARQFGYNANYLSRIFKEQVGITLIDYLYKIRLNALYHDLQTTDRPIGELLTQEGLTNPRTARRLFKTLYNRLPVQVRAAARKHKTEN
ncbi:AraC family transcriptional regulator [Levilactobacillus namurensis]|uniref:AraC family transcriptional regulator n=1 Tax=Levilactobacillus namurensis TaxID=380393 RepID=UPI0026F2969D|nr:AraC family transcriptional regulator [Levilactobacillus namurensis]